MMQGLSLEFASVTVHLFLQRVGEGGGGGGVMCKVPCRD